MRARYLVAGLSLALAGVLLPELTAQGRTSQPAIERSRPNIVVLMTDDQTLESMRVMRNVRRLLAGPGATFSQFIVSYALCCPSRATLLTGQYAHNHRVLSNEPPFGGFARLHARTALPVWLRDAGYHTVHVGKFLNGYGRPQPKRVPPGWSEWYTTVDPTTYRYWNFTMNQNGKLVRYGDAMRDYITDVDSRLAAEVIGRHRTKRKPLYLQVDFLAPHSGAPVALDDPPRMLTPEPAPRHRDRFVFERAPASPSFDEENVRDKPLGVRRRVQIEDYVAFAITENYQQRLEALLAVDEAVAAIVRALERAGELANTYIFFTSDNGFFGGEHRVPNGKVLPYEEALRVPLVVRGPGIAPGTVLPQLTANIDLAPTIAELARIQPGRIVDGVSLVELLKTGRWSVARDAIVIEGGPFDKPSQEFTGLRTPTHQYTAYGNGEEELYDLAADPYQLENRVADPALAAVRAELTERLERLRFCSGVTCRP